MSVILVIIFGLIVSFGCVNVGGFRVAKFMADCEITNSRCFVRTRERDFDFQDGTSMKMSVNLGLVCLLVFVCWCLQALRLSGSAK
jgi:hypothetical protein